MKRVLIFGATSAIAQVCAQLFAERGDKLFLVGRDQQKLSILANDLNVRGAAQVWCEVSDATDFDRLRAVFIKGVTELEQLDIVLLAQGVLGSVQEDEQSFTSIRNLFEVNTLSVFSVLPELSEVFERQRSGTLVVISSVAGIRGRRSNYIYGASKAALTTFLSGYRGRMRASNIKVLTVMAGSVDTPMTTHLRQGPLFSSPEHVGRAIVRAVDRGTNKDYFVPWYWRPIMLVIRFLPERLFQSLKV